ERLAEAATVLCDLAGHPGSQQSPCGLTPEPITATSTSSCLATQRELDVMDALAAAVVRDYCLAVPAPAPASSACEGAVQALPPPPAPSVVPNPRNAWAVAQLLWACAKAQYWDGPPEPPRTAEVSSARPMGQQDGWTAAAGVAPAAAVTAAAASPVALPWSSLLAPQHRSCPAAADGQAPDPAADPSTAAAAAHLSGLTLGGDSSPPPPLCNGADANGRHHQGPHCSSKEEDTTNSTSSTSGEPTASAAAAASSVATSVSARGPWRPLAVCLLQLLASDGCRLVAQLDDKSVAVVWWSLAKAATTARIKHHHSAAATAATAPGCPKTAATAAAAAAAAAAPSVAAAAVVSAASPALLTTLEGRAAEGLRQADVPQLCALFYSCACMGGIRVPPRLVRA
ncbi:hypothetical protein Agub_g1938, partial [Astrephomene gubernaculifera]